jgi:hypothetical protein
MIWEIRGFIRNIKHIPYQIKQGVKNIIIWLPIIWKDRDFDHSYMYEIMYFKLRNMQKFFESNNTMCANSNCRARQIMIAKNLCKRLIEQNYLSNALTNYESKYGDNYDFHFEPVEGKPFHRLVWDWTEKQEKEFKKASDHSEYMEQQDLNYLFTHMRKYIQGWWD